MSRIDCILVALLACSACSSPGPSGEPGSATPAAAAAITSPPATGGEQQEAMGIESHVVLKKFPAKSVELPIGNLKPSYPDRETFLADVKANQPPQAIALDDTTVWNGFGPAARYHTSSDGSISR